MEPEMLRNGGLMGDTKGNITIYGRHIQKSGFEIV
jgi:hypothetical protein